MLRLRQRALGAALAGVALLASARSASAQPRDSAGAEKLYEEASKLLAKEDWAGACAKFKDSFTLDPAPGTMLNLASCAEHEGKLALAWSRFKEAQSLNADTKSDKQREQISGFIGQALARLEPRLPYLTVKLTPVVPGATLTRDGQPIVAESALPLDPGEHKIEAAAPGYLAVTRTVTVREAQRETVELTLEKDDTKPGGPDVKPGTGPKTPPDTPPPQPPRAPATRMSALRIAGFVIGGVGAATLGASLGTGVAALGKEGDLEDLGCRATDHDTTACPSDVTAQAQDISHEGAGLALASTVTTFVGATALGVGVVLVAIGADEPVSDQHAVRIVPRVGPTLAGLSLEGAF